MVVIGQPLPRRRRRSLWLTFLLLLLIAIIVLLITNGVVMLMRSNDVPTRPTPGALLYATTFDQNNDNWQQEPGQASTQIQNGAMIISIDEVRSIYSLLNQEFTDLDLRVTVTLLDAPGETGSSDEFGVLFRFKDADNYYAFKLRADGAFRVELYKNGELDVISQWPTTPTLHIDVGKPNQIRIIAHGEKFRFFFNDQQLDLCLKGPSRYSTWDKAGNCLSNGNQVSESFVDASLDWGKIAIAANATFPGLRVSFDNVLIYGPS
ncbi:MAG: hypothetical protein KF726_08715 [Anaerolineae bacterium]|nr:hypothetical protein [Anaerolineae bacterium]